MYKIVNELQMIAKSDKYLLRMSFFFLNPIVVLVVPNPLIKHWTELNETKPKLTLKAINRYYSDLISIDKCSQKLLIIV